MRKVCLVAIVGLMAPGLAGAQGLGPRTVLPMHVPCAELPIAAEPTIPLTVAASERGDGRLILSLGELVVIHAGTDQGLARGQSFLAHHVDRGRAGYNGNWDGYTGVRFGRDGFHGGLRATAHLTVERINERFSLARIVKACDQVQVGDYLAPVALPALPTPTAAGAPDFDDRATVLFGRDLRETFGDGDILSIDRGSSHGVTPGMRFMLFHTPERGRLYRLPGGGATNHVPASGMPLSERGEAVVLDVTENTARAIVVRVREFIRLGDTAVRVVPGKVWQ
jgi:hypothetical protein